MQIKHELIDYGKNQKVWAGKYKNSQNLPHWHYDCELLYLEKGRLNIVCDKKAYYLTEKQAFFIDSEQLHSINAEEPDSLVITLFFKRDLIKKYVGELTLASPCLARDYDIPAIYRELLHELREKDSYFETLTSISVTRLMLEIFRSEQTTPRAKSKQTTESFKKLLDRLSEDYEFFSFESAAEYMSMNPAYFSRFFHNLTGMTFSRYLNYIKLNKAINMLHSADAEPVTEIAIQCGFSTIRTFNRVFKEMTGYTPTNLPDNFILDETLSRSGSSYGNPTLTGCELIESSDG